MEPSREERELIHQFRSRVFNILETEEQKSAPFLLRWIRAQDHNLSKAEEMLRNSLKWRKENKIDALLQKRFDPFMQQHYPYWIDGRDRQGRPVITYSFGQWNIKKAVDCGMIEEFVDWSTNILERSAEQLRKIQGENPHRPWPITQVVVIIDCKDYSYSQLMSAKACQSILKLVTSSEAHYPEMLYRAFYINCPRVGYMLYSMIKRMLSPKTAAKVVIAGTNRKDWEGLVREVIAPEEIREPFGGTKK